MTEAEEWKQLSKSQKRERMKAALRGEAETDRGVAYAVDKLSKGKTANMNKRQALADLAYGRRSNVIKEVEAANQYRKNTGRKPLYIDRDKRRDILVKPAKDGRAYWSATEGYITSSYNPTTEEESDDAMGYMKGDVSSPAETIGHELTHDLTDRDYWDTGKLGRGYPKFSEDDGVEALKLNAEKGLVYPEMNPQEFAPALAALTRHEYKSTGKRITDPKHFDKKISDFLGKSPKERMIFRKGLPVEASRFYGYVDKLAAADVDNESRLDILLKVDGSKQRENDKATIKKVEGKDRLKRFLDISREMIPSLVKRQKSTDNLLRRRV